MPATLPLSADTHSAAEVVAVLGLEPLDQEGGYFRRTLEAPLYVRPDGEGDTRLRAYSAIYSLFTPDDFSALHVLDRDEIWCWHAGDALESLRLHPDGSGEWVTLGPDLAAGQQLQNVVPAQDWQGTRLAPGGRWALVSCIVAPEFVWDSFVLADRAELTVGYPDWADGIAALTRETPPSGVR